MRTIDADGHIVEGEAMFADLPGEFYPRRPVSVFMPADTVRGDFNGAWIIEGKTYPTLGTRGRTTFLVPGDRRTASHDASVGSQTLSDVEARLGDLDQRNIDVQIIYPSLFLVSSASDIKLEGALFNAYNTYLAQACAKSKGRLSWAALIPFRDPEAAVAEIQRVSDLGAAGIFTMGMVWDRSLDDPTFHPVYSAAEKHDLPICIHLGWSSPQVTDLFSDGRAFFCSATVPVIWGFVAVMGTGLLTRFPKLRVGFLETGAGWVPYTVQQLQRRSKPVAVSRDKTGQPVYASGIDREHYQDPEQLIRSGRAFVNCEGDEDFRYLFEHLGDGALMCSSDFPHEDASAEGSFVANWRARSDMPDTVKQKLIGENAARFYRL